MTSVNQTPKTEKEPAFERRDVPTYDGGKMLGVENTAHIVLDDQVYVLRKTRQNKLILTK